MREVDVDLVPVPGRRRRRRPARRRVFEHLRSPARLGAGVEALAQPEPERLQHLEQRRGTRRGSCGTCGGRGCPSRGRAGPGGRAARRRQCCAAARTPARSPSRSDAARSGPTSSTICAARDCGLAPDRSPRRTRGVSRPRAAQARTAGGDPVVGGLLGRHAAGPRPPLDAGEPHRRVRAGDHGPAQAGQRRPVDRARRRAPPRRRPRRRRGGRGRGRAPVRRPAAGRSGAARRHRPAT